MRVLRRFEGSGTVSAGNRSATQSKTAPLPWVPAKEWRR